MARTDILSRAAGRLGSRRVLAAVVAVAVLAGAGTYGALSLSGSDGKKITTYFDAAVGVHTGADLRVLGVPVGSVDSVDPEGERVKVTVTLDEDVRVPADAKAVVITPSVVSGRYIQLSPAYTGGPRMEDGDVIPVSRTATPVEIDELYASVTDLTEALGPDGANASGELNELVETGAENLQGNGKAIGDSIEQFAAASRTLSGGSKDFFEAIGHLQKFTTMLKKNDRKVRTAEQQLAEVTAYLSDDKEILADALKELARGLGKVQAFIKDNRAGLKSNVDDLVDLTRVVVAQRRSLAESFDILPLATDNVLNAYNPKSRTLDGRGNLNELSMGGSITIPQTGTEGLVPVPRSRAEQLPDVPLPPVGDVYGTPEDQPDAPPEDQEPEPEPEDEDEEARP